MFENVLGGPFVQLGPRLVEVIRQLYGLVLGALYKHLAGVDEANGRSMRPTLRKRAAKSG